MESHSTSTPGWICLHNCVYKLKRFGSFHLHRQWTMKVTIYIDIDGALKLRLFCHKCRVLETRNRIYHDIIWTVDTLYCFVTLQFYNKPSQKTREWLLNTKMKRDKIDGRVLLLFSYFLVTMADCFNHFMEHSRYRFKHQ